MVIRGANMMRGNLNVGIFDEDGYLRIVDRIKDMIIRGGENIYPKEIETALYGHDGVLEAVVVGRPDRVLGEVVIAYVALRPGADVTVDEPDALCADRLTKYKRPVLIEVLENPVGKLDKPAFARARHPRSTPFVGGAAPASPIVGVN